MSYKLKLSGDKIIVKVEQIEEQTSVGLYVPDLSYAKPLIGDIIECSEEVKGYAVGGKVMYLNGGIAINYQEQDCMLLTSGQIVGNLVEE